MSLLRRAPVEGMNYSERKNVFQVPRVVDKAVALPAVLLGNKKPPELWRNYSTMLIGSSMLEIVWCLKIIFSADPKSKWEQAVDAQMSERRTAKHPLGAFV